MPRPLSDEERRDLRKIYRVVEAFRTVDREMPVQQMATLLIVALNEGLSLKEISDRLATASSTASRNVAALSKVHRLGKRGHDLVSSREDPVERRRKMHTLTAKGRLFILRLLGAEDA